MRRRALSLGLALWIATPGAGWAWGAAGHRAVGALAERLLAGTRAERNVRAILGEGSSLAEISVWADCAKGVRRDGDRFRYVHGPGHPECAPFERPQERRELEAFVRENAAACPIRADENTCGHRSYHFTDVAIQRDRYDRRFVGTSDHDIVAAIHAAVAVLQGGVAPPPFRIDSKRDALRLLAHLVGDLHQPLHVGTAYLDASGRMIDPDATHVDVAKASTAGGNRILDGTTNLHAEWDRVDRAVARRAQKAVAAARAVPATSGSPTAWPEAWATDTLVASRSAYDGLRYARRSRGTWSAELPADYDERRDRLQERQLVKAGARLAQLLESIWP